MQKSLGNPDLDILSKMNVARPKHMADTYSKIINRHILWLHSWCYQILKYFVYPGPWTKTFLSIFFCFCWINCCCWLFHFKLPFFSDKEDKIQFSCGYKYKNQDFLCFIDLNLLIFKVVNIFFSRKNTIGKLYFWI